METNLQRTGNVGRKRKETEGGKDLTLMSGHSSQPGMETRGWRRGRATGEWGVKCTDDQIAEKAKDDEEWEAGWGEGTEKRNQQHPRSQTSQPHPVSDTKALDYHKAAKTQHIVYR